MQAIAVFPEQRALRLIEHPEPHIEHDTQVLLRMLEVGVCGTDREIARFAYGSPPKGSEYLVLGHESLAEVAQVGAKVRSVRPGDLVVSRVRHPCAVKTCPGCAMGRPDFCNTGQYTERGIAGRHGFMTEWVVEDAEFLHRLPRQLARVGVLTEPLTVTEKALTEVVNVQDRLPWLAGREPSGTAVVLGAGPVGLLASLALLVRGFALWVYSREVSTSPKADWVRSVGGQYISTAEATIEELTARVGNIDLILEATGAAKLSFEALAALGSNGVFIFTGVPGRKAPVELDASGIMRRLVLENQLLYGTVNAGPDAFERAIVDLGRFEQRWPGRLEALITERAAPGSFAELIQGERSGIKRVLRFGAPE